MRVALAQINITVGDIDGNVRRILETIGRAQALGRATRCFRNWRSPAIRPRTCCTRTTSSRTTSTRSSWSRRRAATRARRLRGPRRRQLYNAVAMCGNDRGAAALPQATAAQLRRVRRGALLRSRARRPASSNSAAPCSANTICEDIWVPELAAEAAEMGARVIFNISASPFHAGKGAEREEMLRRARARQRRVARVLQPRRRPGRARLRRPQRRHLARRARWSPAARPSRRTSSSPTSHPRAAWARRSDLAAEVTGTRGGLRGARAGAARLRGQERLHRRRARPVRRHRLRA